MVMKYRSTRICPAGYHVGQEEVSNRPKPYQRLGHSPIVLHVSAKTLFRIGQALKDAWAMVILFYMNWPRLFWPRGNLESAEAISALGPQSNHFTCVGRDSISNRPGPSGCLSHGDTVLWELAQGYIVSAEGLLNRPIHYYCLGHKCTSFYTNWPMQISCWPSKPFGSTSTL